MLKEKKHSIVKMKQMRESSTDASSVGLLSFPLKTLGVDST